MRRKLLVLLALALCTWAATAAFLFVWPREDHPRRADAIVVLSGDLKHRLPRGLELARAGVSRVLVVSDGARSKFQPARDLCAHPAGRSFEVVCFRPDPYSTRGEARAVQALAIRRGWRSVLVVTSTFHVFRARMIFERCLDDHAHVYVGGVSTPRRKLPIELVSETFKLGLALTLRRGC